MSNPHNADLLMREYMTYQIDRLDVIGKRYEV